jgi:hypothetical protein
MKMMRQNRMKKHPAPCLHYPASKGGGSRLHRLLEVGSWRLHVSVRRSRFCTLIAVFVMARGILAFAQPTNAAAGTDYASFSKFIAERNIFNPNRYRITANIRRDRPTRIVRRPSFSLAGLMSYGEGETPGIYAFFDGTSSDYRIVLARDATIAVFKVAAIDEDSVTLLLDTNKTVMKVGMQMRDEGGGHWVLTTEPVSYGRDSVDEPGPGYSGRRRGDGRNGFSLTPGVALADNADTNALGNATEPDTMADQGDAPPDGAGAPPEPAAAQTLALPAGPASQALMRLMQLRQQEEQQSGGNRN